MSMTTELRRATGRIRGLRASRCALLAGGVLSLLLIFAPAGARADFSTDGEVAGLRAQYMSVNGVRTRYYEAGSGEPVVLVHGGDFSGHSSANVWSRDIPLFAKRFHVLAPDALASGLTDNPADDNDLNLQGEVDHLYDFIRALKLGPVHLVGEGRGGGCVFFLALQHPDVVKDIVIVNSNTAAPASAATNPQAAPGCPKDPDAEAWKCRTLALSSAPDRDFDDDYFMEGKFMSLLPKSQQTAAKLKAGAGGELGTAAGFDRWKTEWYARIAKEGVLEVPVLIYWSKMDPSSPVANGVAMYDALSKANPRVRIITLDKAGHFPFREDPQRFVDELSSFFQDAQIHSDSPGPQVSSNPAN